MEEDFNSKPLKWLNTFIVCLHIPTIKIVGRFNPKKNQFMTVTL